MKNQKSIHVSLGCSMLHIHQIVGLTNNLTRITPKLWFKVGSGLRKPLKQGSQTSTPLHLV